MFKPIQYQEISSKDSDYEHFIWNQQLVNEFAKIGGNSGWCKQIIQGFFGMTTREKMDDYCYTMITRKSYQMGGMRFFSRGINKNGYVANYCETEEILMGSLKVVSHIQIRGSVPCYWQQGGAVSPPMLSCPLESSNDVFIKHMDNLKKWYDGTCTIFNLLSESRAGEPSLSEAWRDLISKYKAQLSTDYLHVDFHAVTKGNDFSYVNKYIIDYKETQTKMGYNVFKVKIPDQNSEYYTGKNQPVAMQLEEQKGIFRTNCVDCLDRTNAWMTKLGFLALQDMLKILNIQKYLTSLPLNDIDGGNHEESSFMFKFKNIWADNGDYISKSYTGTGATTSATTRKGQGGLNGLVDHKIKSISRFYLAQFEDHKKQTALTNLVGNSVLESPYTQKNSNNEGENTMDNEIRQIKRSQSFYTSSEKIKVNVFSWNVSLDKKDIHESVVREFFYTHKGCNILEGDQLAIGLQDIYKISATNIMNLSSHMESLCRTWENVITAYLQKVKPDFELVNNVRHEDCFLMVYASKRIKHRITNVEMDGVKFSVIKKFAKKGAVILKLDIDDTTFGFVNCHLTSDIDNFMYRISDIKHIFKSIESVSELDNLKVSLNLEEDQICQFGNLNFRLNATSPQILYGIGDYQEAMNKDNNKYFALTKLGSLLIADQLNDAKIKNDKLSYFQEEDITFLPTYKFDQYSGQYLDNSDNAPAWTDRILWSKSSLNETTNNFYTSISQIKLGNTKLHPEHNPVIGSWDMEVKTINRERSKKLMYNIENGQCDGYDYRELGENIDKPISGDKKIKQSTDWDYEQKPMDPRRDTTAKKDDLFDIFDSRPAPKPDLDEDLI